VQAEAELQQEESPRKTLGQTLAAERERQGLSRADAAQRLHMSAYQIEALETGDYSRLPKGTFLRGFVRNYAKVLGVPADTVMPLLTEDAPRDGRPGIVVPTQNIRFDPLGDRLQNPYVKAVVLAFVVVSLAFAAMYWWIAIRPSPPAARRSVEPVPAVVAAPPPATSPAPMQIAATVALPAPEPVAPPKKAEAPKAEAPKAAPKVEPPKIEAPKTEPPKVAVASPVQPVAPVNAAAASGGSVLKFRFTGNSWVEIRDAKGKIILSKLNAAGTETEVAGKPPFNVIVGNAPEVRLFYNDRAFDLEPHTKVAVARFTIE
jgi:cytoskeleton protein RodZ